MEGELRQRQRCRVTRVAGRTVGVRALTPAAYACKVTRPQRLSAAVGQLEIAIYQVSSASSQGQCPSGERGEWLNPWLKLLKLLNLASSHAVAAISLAFLWWLVGNVIDSISGQQLEWKIIGVEISLSEIVHYGDLCILIAFFLKLLIDLFRWTVKS
jgi:hypothetical protein